MGGKFGGLREGLQRVGTREINLEEEHKPTAPALLPIKQTLPFIASPLDPKTTEWLKKKHEHSNLTLKRRPTVAQQEAHRVSGGIFRKQHEASPLELFFDLFFVANLAVYGFKTNHATPGNVANYIAFFSLMWSFWFHVSIHDVRFYVDSVLNRFIKLCQFAIFTSFIGLGPLFKIVSKVGQPKAFNGMALVFMISRLILVVQYGVVFWFVRPLKRTIIPMGLMMLLYLASAIAFLETYIHGKDRTINTDTGKEYIYAWYIIVGVEALLVIIISSIWRILSFKATHLVERAGLLTLIIMGEGIIGIVKAVAVILDGTKITIWDVLGRVVSGVLLIYLIFVLYFTPIAHDRFGTIRQQFWVLLHWPLHVAILTVVESGADALVWTTARSAAKKLIHNLPQVSQPSSGYPTIESLVNRTNWTMTDASQLYTYLHMPDYVKWNVSLTKLQDVAKNTTYASAPFNDQAGKVLGSLIAETTNFYFANFQFKGPDKAAYEKDPTKKMELYNDAMTNVFLCFYISGGGLLFVLGLMYLLGKRNKTWDEWLGVSARIVFGIALPFLSFLAESDFMFNHAGWIVPTVVLSYFAVTVLDNTAQNLYDKLAARRARKGELNAEDLESLNRRHSNNAFGPSESVAEHLDHLKSMGHHEDHEAHAEREKKVIKSRTIRFDGPSRSNSSESDDENDAGHKLARPRTHSLPSHDSQHVDPYSAIDHSDYHHTGENLHLEPMSHRRRTEDEDFNNDPSFEQERLISPATIADMSLERPQEGYHRPEDRGNH